MTPQLAEAIDAFPKVHAAYHFASGAHAAVGQLRKYTNEPYIVHPVEVAGIVLSVGASEDEVCAALLHDVLEDTGVTAVAIQRLFGVGVLSLVLELTDYYTPELFPNMARKDRKFLEAHRYMSVSPGAKKIKLADGLSNTPSIAQHDPTFMKVYGPEKRNLWYSLREGHDELWLRLDKMLKEVGY